MSRFKVSTKTLKDQAKQVKASADLNKQANHVKIMDMTIEERTMRLKVLIHRVGRSSCFVAQCELCYQCHILLPTADPVADLKEFLDRKYTVDCKQEPGLKPYIWLMVWAVLLKRRNIPVNSTIPKLLFELIKRSNGMWIPPSWQRHFAKEIVGQYKLMIRDCLLSSSKAKSIHGLWGQIIHEELYLYRANNRGKIEDTFLASILKNLDATVLCAEMIHDPDLYRTILGYRAVGSLTVLLDRIDCMHVLEPICIKELVVVENETRNMLISGNDYDTVGQRCRGMVVTTMSWYFDYIVCVCELSMQMPNELYPIIANYIVSADMLELLKV